ncbi:MAG: VOC family protein, partial [Candidatus Binataceae bacterium]
IMHAEIRIRDSIIEVSEATNEWTARPVALHLYIDDADACYKRAIAAGATSIRDPSLQFYGDREGDVKDPFGNFWFIATHLEDVPSDELRRRLDDLNKRSPRG